MRGGGLFIIWEYFSVCVLYSMNMKKNKIVTSNFEFTISFLIGTYVFFINCGAINMFLNIVALVFQIKYCVGNNIPQPYQTIRGTIRRIP